LGYTEMNIALGQRQITRTLLIFYRMRGIVLRFRGVA
jgi:hypothetical protein